MAQAVAPHRRCARDCPRAAKDRPRGDDSVRNALTSGSSVSGVRGSGEAMIAVMTVSANYQTSGIGASLVVSALRVPLLARLVPHVAELRYRGRRSGRHIALPVQCAHIGDTIVVRVARAQSKAWWRNFTTPHPISIHRDGRGVEAIAHVAFVGTLEHEELSGVLPAGLPPLRGSHSRPARCDRVAHTLRCHRPAARPHA